MRKKRLGAIALLLASTLFALAACGGDTAEKTTGAGTTEAGSTGDSTEETAEEPGEAKSLTWWIDMQESGSEGLTTYDEMPNWQQIQENTGIDIVWQHPPSGQTREQFSLIMASDQLPDIIYYNWQSGYSGGPDQAIADGKIIALNDHLDQAPNLKAYLEKYPDVKKMVTTDQGNLYVFPATYTHTSTDSEAWQPASDREPFYEPFIGLIIRTDLLEEAGLEMPVTLDDWLVTLRAFKEMGVTYPLTFNELFWRLSSAFATTFDVTLPVSDMLPDLGYGLREDGSIQFGPAEPEYKEFLSFMRTLAEEGLLDPDYMVQDPTQVRSKAARGEAGAWIDMVPVGIGDIEKQVKAEDPDSTFSAAAVPHPVKEAGQELRYYQCNFPYTKSGAAISTSCEDVDTAIALLDYLWDDEGNKIINWGIEDTSYEMVDGWPQFTEEMQTDFELRKSMGTYRQLNGPWQQDHWTRLVGKRNYELAEGEVDNNLQALEIWGANGTVPAGLPPTTILDEESDAYATAFNEILTYSDEMTSNFILGNTSLDEFDSYVDSLKGLGLQECLDIQTAALERYNNR